MKKLEPVCLCCQRPDSKCKCTPEQIEKVKDQFRTGQIRWDEDDEEDYQNAAQGARK